MFNIRFTRSAVIAASCLVFGSMFAGNQAQAAHRKVLYEKFTATWCGYCPYMGRAMSNLLDDYPEDTIGFQCHVSDAYTTSWGNTRANKYNVGGIPHILADGTFEQVGAYQNDQQNYNILKNWMNSRQAVPTDVTVDVTAVPVSGQTYHVTIVVGVESDGTAKTMEIYTVNTLNHYPSAVDNRYNYCVREGWNEGQFTVNPGDSVTVERDITFDTTSWDNKENIRIIAFAQEPGSGKTEVYNANGSDYPFIDTLDHQVVEVPISAAAKADDPTLENAATYDLQVVTIYDDDWTSTDVTATVDGSFYQHPNFDDSVPQTSFWASFPSLQFDSFFSAPEFAVPGFAQGPDVTNDSMSAIWFDTNTTPEGTYTIARFTVTSGTMLTMSGTTTAHHTAGELLPFSFDVPIDLGGCEGDINGDGQRDQADLGTLLASYGIDGGGDLDGDGDTDQADLGILLAVYGVPCP